MFITASLITPSRTFIYADGNLSDAEIAELRNQLVDKDGTVYPTPAGVDYLTDIVSTNAGAVESLSEITVVVRGRNQEEHRKIMAEAIQGQECLFHLWYRQTESDDWDLLQRVAAIIDESKLGENDAVSYIVVPKFLYLNRAEAIYWSDVDHRRRCPEDGWFSELSNLETKGQEITI